MIPHYPIALYLCGAFLLGLIWEACTNFLRPWSIPAIAVYLTTLGWYFVDPFQAPEAYANILPQTLSLSYLQVGLFLLTVRCLAPKLSQQFSRKLNPAVLIEKAPSPEQLFGWLVWLWAPLLAIGVARLNGNIFAALFPLEGRTAANMWGRGALGGSLDSLVSTGGYIYQLVCGLFGVTLILQRNRSAQIFNLGLWLLSVPYFLLSGTRSIFIAMISPLFLTYLLVGRRSFQQRLVFVAIAGLGVHFILLTVIENRNTGFRFLFDKEAMAEKQATDAANAFANQAMSSDQKERGRKQEGLNMIQELCFVNEFSDSKVFEPEYGMRYLTELTNVVPRALWPGKPMLGIDYAIWRGFGNDNEGIGVNATISTGMIGGGVLNFGKWFGPIAAGMLLAIWAALLARWWQQRQSILRLCLFMAGLGLTFNLGRDITLLVLWPVVFAFVLVKLAEYFSQRKTGKRRPSQRLTGDSVSSVRRAEPSSVIRDTRP